MTSPPRHRGNADAGGGSCDLKIPEKLLKASVETAVVSGGKASLASAELAKVRDRIAGM